MFVWSLSSSGEMPSTEPTFSVQYCWGPGATSRRLSASTITGQGWWAALTVLVWVL